MTMRQMGLCHLRTLRIPPASAPERVALLFQILLAGDRALDRGHRSIAADIQLDHDVPQSLGALEHVKDGGQVDLSLAQRTVSRPMLAARVVLQNGPSGSAAENPS